MIKFEEYQNELLMLNREIDNIEKMDFRIIAKILILIAKILFYNIRVKGVLD